jgi:hypothetical protein
MSLDYNIISDKKEQYVSTYVQFGKEGQTIIDLIKILILAII